MNSCYVHRVDVNHGQWKRMTCFARWCKTEAKANDQNAFNAEPEGKNKISKAEKAAVEKANAGKAATDKAANAAADKAVADKAADDKAAKEDADLNY